MDHAVSGLRKPVCDAARSAPSGDVIAATAGEVHFCLGRRESDLNHTANGEGARKTLVVQAISSFRFHILVVVSRQLYESGRGSFDGRSKESGVFDVARFVGDLW